MKLSAINPINNNQIKKIQQNNNTQNANFKLTNSISSNTLQEAIGRSQVHFKGIGQITPIGFKYHNASGFGKSEDISYNPKTGEFEYNEVIKDKNVIKRTIKFIPSSKEQIIIEENTNGTTTTTLVGPKGKKIDVVDSKKRNIYSFEQTNDGKTKTITTEYARGRKIVEVQNPDQPKKITVIDLILPRGQPIDIQTTSKPVSWIL